MIELEGRDPFTLWVHWQVDRADIPQDRDLHIRIFAHSLEGPWMLEQPVPRSGHRTLPVLYANTVYLAALGVVSESGAWVPLAVSAPVRTAPDGPATAWTSETALFSPGRTVEGRPAEDPSSTTAPGTPWAGLPDVATATVLTALAIESLESGTDPNSSASVAIRTRIHSEPHELGKQPVDAHPGSAAWTVGTAPVPGSLPVPSAVSPGSPGFWFRVHAELILHGSTEPGALVSVGGHPIGLREDGSFTFRFSLPNGSFDLPVEAVKADGSDRRAAHLAVTRQTTERGEVGLHPIDPALRPPVVESLR